MARKYVKFDEVVKLLNDGWEIFTDTGAGGTPYTPLFFSLYKGKRQSKHIHPSTMSKLIREQIINSRENETGEGKYALRKING